MDACHACISSTQRLLALVALREPAVRVQASVVAALSRDQVFERVAPGTYALSAVVRLSR